MFHYFYKKNWLKNVCHVTLESSYIRSIADYDSSWMNINHFALYSNLFDMLEFLKENLRESDLGKYLVEFEIKSVNCET